MYGLFSIFCQLSFIVNVIAKNNFSEPAFPEVAVIPRTMLKEAAKYREEYNVKWTAN